ncbi:hypothetical protein CRM22_005765 [Opisthorchis felineus]|uniref:N-acetylgalactosaminide beta-1,3-galactosyltransferase n=1 Tax=Opisthorchis felineus TaxID=147828 RepID=A0A4S2LPJ9_OPIFE|nr:hypothetical protein CRM22_005765 [Opisthorchis felineus]
MGWLGGFRLNLCTMVIFTFGVLFGVLLGRFYFVHMEPVFIPTATVKMDFRNDTYGHSNESLIADELFRKVRVVCMILTMPKNHEDKAIVVQNTWASRCNVHFFLSSVENESLHSLAAVQEESREALWDKTKFGIRHAVEKYSDYDFFLKADDDTFVIVENLRKLLRDLNPNDPFIMGRRFRPHVKQGYLSGGGGYVISRAALLRIHNGLANDTRCAGKAHGGAEDVRLDPHVIQSSFTYEDKSLSFSPCSDPRILRLYAASQADAFIFLDLTLGMHPSYNTVCTFKVWSGVFWTSSWSHCLIFISSQN